MIIDARTLEASRDLRADVCIIGAGPAGITLAVELEGSGASVVVLESGGLEWETDAYQLSDGEIRPHGIPYTDLRYARWRGFGGSPTLWDLDVGTGRPSARYRPLESIDFEGRPWAAGGWPLDLEELQPYYRRAQEICGLGHFDYRAETWLSSEARALATRRLESAVFQGGPASRFIKHPVDPVRQSKSIRLYHHITVHELEMRADLQRLRGVRTVDRAGRTGNVTAGLFVVAGGGIENPRLLMASGGGIGNEHDQVGRHFMEHFHSLAGVLVPTDQDLFNQAELHSWHVVNETPIQQKYRVDEGTARSLQMLGFCLFLVPAAVGSLPPDSRRAVERLGSGIERVFRLETMAEQAPNRASRVTLSDTVDEAGFRLVAPHSRRAALEWQLSSIDVRTLLSGQEVVLEEFTRAGLGRVFTRLTQDNLRTEIYGGNHHMGTTRMSNDPHLGVVDSNCRVHSVDNLYVAGSSTFPTGGFANPTLTIVALAVRLARHLRGLLEA